MILLLLAYLDAIAFHVAASWSSVGPPCPMICDLMLRLMIFWGQFLAHLAIPASVIMKINDTRSSRSQASLDEIIIFLQVSVIDRTSKDVVRQELPADGQAEHVEAVVVDEVLHLSCTICSVVFREGRPGSRRLTGSVRVASEVEASDVDSGESQRACAGWWRVGRACTCGTGRCNGRYRRGACRAAGGRVTARCRRR